MRNLQEHARETVETVRSWPSYMRTRSSAANLARTSAVQPLLFNGSAENLSSTRRRGRTQRSR